MSSLLQNFDSICWKQGGELSSGFDGNFQGNHFLWHFVFAWEAIQSNVDSFGGCSKGWRLNSGFAGSGELGSRSENSGYHFVVFRLPHEIRAVVRSLQTLGVVEQQRQMQNSNVLSAPDEVRTITAISSGGTYRGFAIQLDSPLVYGHYAGLEYQSEVALLSRRINFAGEQTNDNFGGHVMCQGSTALCQISGVAADNMGQLNVLGRYPFHAHLVIDCDYCY